jgi:arylsulfatase A-like enzyme
MKFHIFLKATLMAGCCLMALGMFGCKNEGEMDLKPNIILVMADDQGWGDMAYNGHPVLRTPHFDDMASSGLRFDRFYAAAPLCSPTRGSVMTGRHPNRFGCFKWGNTLRPQEKTIAQALKTAGYATGHFGKWHLGPVFKSSPINPGASGFDEWISAPNFFENDPIFSNQGVAVQAIGESSMVTVDAAIEFIGKHNTESRPFFALICFGSPHAPHIAVDQDRALYADQEEKFQHFYGEITGMDRALGKLRQELKRLDIDKNTILWYFSDNGGLNELGSTGGRSFKGSIYEGGLRVPAILEWPTRIKNPRVTNIPCNTSDFYPTLLEIAGVSIKDQPVLDGISLVPLISDKIKERHEPMGFWQHLEGGLIVPSHKIMLELLEKQQAGDMEVDRSMLGLNAGEITKQYPTDIFPGHAAWLKWPYKLHRIQENSNNVTLELYNLEKDPMEENDLSDTDLKRAYSMKSQLEEWLLSVVESLNGNDYQ